MAASSEGLLMAKLPAWSIFGGGLVWRGAESDLERNTTLAES